jgi:predicted MPP superfamily phosphohydrolase
MNQGRMLAEYPSFRRPLPPGPVEAFDIPHPDLPAELDGLTILHVADVHGRRAPHALLPGPFSRLLEAVRVVRPDLVALTGDFMQEPGHEEGGLRALRALAAIWRDAPPRLGVFGIFGNHDTRPFAAAARASLPEITWLDTGGSAPGPGAVEVAGGRLRLAGLPWPEDPLGAALRLGPPAKGPGAPFTIMLAHLPSAIVPAAALGVPLVLAGHTHGGQVRLSARLAPYTACDAPADRASGMLRLGRTLCCISRGLGEAVWPGLRFRCPPQAPLYTLRRGDLPALPVGADGRSVHQVVAW